jgi:acyl-CoA synthetase (AMP-forming)/AMP-acid ligase II
MNIAIQLSAMARRQPHNLAVVVPTCRDESGHVRYAYSTYQQLDRDSDEIARGLEAMGIARGTRAVVMVRPGLDFFALVFAVFKAGIVPVLIDPGIGLRNLGQCCREAEPGAFIGIPKAVWARRILGWGRGTVRQVIVVGPRRVSRSRFAATTLDEVRQAGREALENRPDSALASDPLAADELAAILFTSGSTGPPKGVVYTQAIFNAQVEQIRKIFAIEPGEVDLCTFPLFALFAPALGMTAIVPDMDPTRPALADPAKIIGAIEDFAATNLFGSPALLRQLVRGDAGAPSRLSTVKRVVSAGAPVPSSIIEKMAARLEPPAQVFTTYGATEALPVAAIGSDEILGETRQLTEAGKGVCVGRPVDWIDARVIVIRDEPIPVWSDDLVVPDGTIGEIVVAGTVVTREYFNRPEAFHRMGDLGYRDARGRLWFCGRKAHRVILEDETLYTIPCEAIFNTHPDVFRSALVGVVRRGGGVRKPATGATIPVICIEAVRRLSAREQDRIRGELLELGRGHAHTSKIRAVLFHRAFPVDIRPNSKIFREKLAVWAARRLP